MAPQPAAANLPVLLDKPNSYVYPNACDYFMTSVPYTYRSYPWIIRLFWGNGKEGNDETTRIFDCVADDRHGHHPGSRLIFDQLHLA